MKRSAASKLERDQVPSRRRPPLIRIADVGLMLKLPAAALVAAFVPASHWDRTADLLEGPSRWIGFSGRVIDRATISALIRDQNLTLDADGILEGGSRNARLSQLYYLRSLSPGGWSPEVTVIGTEHLRAALAAGRGAVLWLPPFIFSSLIAKRALHDCGFAVHHLTRSGHGFSNSRFGMAVLNPIRTRVEERYLAERIIIPPSGKTTAAVRALAARLAANKVVSITLTDQGSNQIEVPFLRGQLRVAPGAPHLAIRSKAPLLPVVAVRSGEKHTFSVEVGRPLSAPAGGDRTEKLRALAADCAARLEEPVRRHPDQFQWHLCAARTEGREPARAVHEPAELPAAGEA